MTQVDSAKPIAAAHRRLAALGASAAALLTIGAALIGWSLFNGAGAVRLGPNGAVELAFRGCDARGRCGDFVLFAPGYDFRWNFGKDSRQAAERPDAAAEGGAGAASGGGAHGHRRRSFVE